MDSFALWLSSNTVNHDPIEEVKVDFCIWTGESISLDDVFFDVGVTISSVKDLEIVNLYIPFSVEKHEISDLGSILKEHNVLNTLFNANYTIQNVDGAPKYYLCEHYEDGLFCRPGENGNRVNNIRDIFSSKTKMLVYCLDRNSNIDTVKTNNGTIIQLHGIPKLDETLPVYMRLRIKSANLAGIIRKRNNRSNFFNSLHIADYYIDFKFNDYRSLDANIIEMLHMRKNDKRLMSVSFGLVQLIILATENIDILAVNQVKQKTVDREVWYAYFGIDGTKRNHKRDSLYISNYWQFDSYTACSIYVRMRRVNCSIYTVLSYLLVLIIITCACNLLNVNPNWNLIAIGVAFVLLALCIWISEIELRRNITEGSEKERARRSARIKRGGSSGSFVG